MCGRSCQCFYYPLNLRESGTFYEMYGLPSFLYFDWINNEQWSGDERNVLGDYRFVYFGAQDTWFVGLFIDVLLKIQ